MDSRKKGCGSARYRKMQKMCGTNHSVTETTETNSRGRGRAMWLMQYRKLEVIWIRGRGGRGKVSSKCHRRRASAMIDRDFDHKSLPYPTSSTPFSGCRCGIMPPCLQTSCGLLSVYWSTISNLPLSFSSATYPGILVFSQ